MQQEKLTHRRRMFALAGAAVIAAPLALTPILSSGHANAQSSAQPATSAEQKLPSNFQAPVGSFAPIVAAVKPAVVTVTTKIGGQDTSSSGGAVAA